MTRIRSTDASGINDQRGSSGGGGGGLGGLGSILGGGGRGGGGGLKAGGCCRCVRIRELAHFRECSCSLFLSVLF